MIMMNLPVSTPLPIIFSNPLFLVFISTWSILWKGFALWRAVKNDQKFWYVGLLVVNLLGIPEMIYLVWFAKKDRLWEKILKGKREKD